MTVYGYCRLSAEDRSSMSLETQRDLITAYCGHRFHGRGLRPVFFAEAGVSGGVPIASRREGKRLCESLQTGDHVVFAKLDRAFRSVADAARMIGEFDRRGVVVHFLDLNVDTSQPTGRMVVHVLAAVAEMERERIGERIRDAKKRLRKLGRPWMGPKSCPIGWRMVGPRGKREFRTWPEERRQCRRVQKLRAKGLSFFAVARQAYKEGMRNLRTGKPLSFYRVRYMIHAADDNFSLIGRYCRELGSESPRGGRIDWSKPKYRRGPQAPADTDYAIPKITGQTARRKVKT